MTLPKGYKSDTKSRDDDNETTTRPRQNKGWGRAIISLIFFIIFLSLTIHFLIKYMEEAKEIDGIKKALEQSKLDYENGLIDAYGEEENKPILKDPKTGKGFKN
jgi:hypothetical protein